MKVITSKMIVAVEQATAQTAQEFATAVSTQINTIEAAGGQVLDIQYTSVYYSSQIYSTAFILYTGTTLSGT